MTLSKETLMTAGAIGFAGFALWYIGRKPAGEVATQPGQRDRDAGLITWFNTRGLQQADLAQKTVDNWYDDMNRKGIL